MQQKEVEIICSDHFVLKGTIYQPDEIRAAVMIAPATGIKKKFYHSFAQHLAENGFGVITYENRGIGDSKNGDINNGNASLITWGGVDQASVLSELIKSFPNTSYHVIGHSAGGQLVGLMENAAQIRSIFNFASSSGSIKNMSYPFKFSAFFFLNIFVPLNNLLFKKTNCQWIGMGEALPKDVAAQWRKWCNGQGYVEMDFLKQITHHHYYSISIPTLWLNATDDDIANNANVADMIRVYKKIDAQRMVLEPAIYGLRHIGHMKYFKNTHKVLWKYAIDWLNEHS